MAICECGESFTPPELENPGFHDARLELCPRCLTTWLARRDQYYARCREENRRLCLERGHVPAPAGHCARCGKEKVS